MADEENGGATARRPLTRDQRLQRVFGSQCRAKPHVADFTEAELDGFAALVDEDGAYDPECGSKFAELWLAHGERRKTEAAAAAEQARPRVIRPLRPRPRKQSPAEAGDAGAGEGSTD